MRATDPTEKTSKVDDERVVAVEPLPPPEQLIRFFPVAGGPIEGFVAASRDRVRRIVHGADDRLLVVIGPCSVHEPRSALEYAHHLVEARQAHDDALEIVMRVYFEKPRTTVGWKGLINDPHLDGSFRINEGLRIARSLLIDINAMGVPAGSELLDTSSPQYMADLLSLGRDRRAHHREPGASRAGLGLLGGDRLQEQHRGQRARGDRRRDRGQPAAQLSRCAQERPDRDGAHRRQSRRPRDPARRRGAQLRCQEHRPGLRRARGRRPSDAA